MYRMAPMCMNVESFNSPFLMDYCWFSNAVMF